MSGARRFRSCVLLAAGALATGCGEDVRLGAGRAMPDAAPPAEDAAPPMEDAAPPADARADASTEAPAFSAPVEIAELAAGEADDDDPSLSSDLRLLFFNSEREGGMGEEDIWFAERDAPGASWRAPTPAAALNSTLRETGIALAADGLTIWWSSDRDGGAGGLDVYRAARATRDAAWSDVQRVDALSSPGDDLISAVASDGRSVLLARRDDEDDDYDLYLAERADAAAEWGAPQAIAELNSDDAESDGFLVGDGTRLLFTRDEDLQLAERADTTQSFGTPIALDALNSDDDDRDAWGNDDLSYVVFSSDRGGSYRLYEAAR